MEHFDAFPPRSPRFRLVLPEEYPDQGPGVRTNKIQQAQIDLYYLYCSSCVLTVVTVVTVVTDLYFTSDVFHPMVGASEMNSQEIGSKGHQKSGTV